jgi:hypothetical protein
VVPTSRTNCEANPSTGLSVAPATVIPRLLQ